MSKLQLIGNMLDLISVLLKSGVLLSRFRKTELSSVSLTGVRQDFLWYRVN